MKSLSVTITQVEECLREGDNQLQKKGPVTALTEVNINAADAVVRKERQITS